MIVCPYLIDTGMFAGVKTRFEFLLPALEPDYVASRIIKSIEYRDNELLLPQLMYIIYLFRVFSPIWFIDFTQKFAGLTTGMEYFIGRKKTN